MREEQLEVLLDYIDAAIADALASEHGRDGLTEHLAKSELRQDAINAICFDEFRGE